jgi:hypothetical protein
VHSTTARSASQVSRCETKPRIQAAGKSAVAAGVARATSLTAHVLPNINNYALAGCVYAGSFVVEVDARAECFRLLAHAGKGFGGLFFQRVPRPYVERPRGATDQILGASASPCAALGKLGANGGRHGLVVIGLARRDPFSKAFHIRLSLAIGGLSETPDPSVYPQQTRIDWLRVWQYR